MLENNIRNLPFHFVLILTYPAAYVELMIFISKKFKIYRLQ